MSEAASRLGVSAQTIRNWARQQTLTGQQDAKGRWSIDAAAVEKRLASEGRKSPRTVDVNRLAQRVEDLATAVEALTAKNSPPELLSALERERDQYRAQAMAVRGAALSLTSAAREVDGAVRLLLGVLEQQADALVQLLAPASPHDLE